MKKFLKYDNKKIYDSESGEYVTMLELSDVVASGEKIRVVQYRTGRDVTVEALARALYDRILARRGGEQPFSPDRLARLIPLVARRVG